MLKFNTLEMRSIGSDEVNSVSARELYLDLGYSDANFTTWIKKNLIPDFIENSEYIAIPLKMENLKGSGGSNKKDYIITLDTAKHLALKTRGERGYKIRDYFIEIENKHSNKFIEAFKKIIETTPLEIEDRFVYFIKAGDAIKIGCTNDVEERLKALQVCNAEELELIGYKQVNESFKVENKLHKHFKEFNIRGEWFRNDAHVALDINYYLKNQPLLNTYNDFEQIRLKSEYVDEQKRLADIKITKLLNDL